MERSLVHHLSDSSPRFTGSPLQTVPGKMMRTSSYIWTTLYNLQNALVYLIPPEPHTSPEAAGFIIPFKDEEITAKEDHSS